MVEENKKMLKVENEVVKKPTVPGVPRRYQHQPEKGKLGTIQ